MHLEFIRRGIGHAMESENCIFHNTELATEDLMWLKIFVRGEKES